MNNHQYIFISVYTDIIKEFLDFHHSLGFKREALQKQLKRFDRFIFSKGISEINLNERIAKDFCLRLPNESQATQNLRVSCIRSLAKFMISKGHDAYVYPPLQRGAYSRTYVPHIFTNHELRRIFIAVDRHIHINKKRGKAYSLIFRILYGTGMRISEILNLTVENIDLDKNLITIKHGKHNRDRLVPVHHELMKKFRDYLIENGLIYTPKVFCFNQDKKPFSRESIYGAFRKYLWEAGISHGGKEKGPRVHDFRHTMVVHRIRDWVKEKRDITALFPYLCAYLGHADTRGTEYYFRLTAEFYPELVERAERYWNEDDINEK
ncbi:MAG: tyrosine-type recombinase/integrase [Chitinispirillales bacterium]|jgi:integrase|nr:tyrosine-type recombinase/integrase [Chitinispirillales bacterium]